MAVEITLTNALIGTGVTLLAGVLVWLVRRTIQFGEDIAVLKTTIKYYIESSTKGAAAVLNSPNPAPAEIRRLLYKHQRGDLDDPREQQKLVAYLAHVIDDPSSPKSEKSAAYTMLNGMEAARLLNPPKPRSFWWPFGRSQ